MEKGGYQMTLDELYEILVPLWNEQFAECGWRRLQDRTAMIWLGIVKSYQDVGKIPQSVRQIYYKVEGYGIVDKTEAGYRRVQRQVLNMRRRGVIKYNLVTDGTRWAHGPTTFDDIDSFLENSRRAYRRDLWAAQDVNVFIWLEKEALYGVIEPVVEEYAINIFISRGFASETYLYSVAEMMQMSDKPAYVYSLYDFDRSGQIASDHIFKKLSEFGASANYHRLGLTATQIAEHGLSTRPAKKSDIKRGWEWGYACELDALPANELRGLVAGAIERHVDPYALETQRKIEAMERASFGEVIANMAARNN
jgi:hypothetical protein